MAQTAARQTARELHVGIDARQRMLDFYLERDREDAERYADGTQRGRGGVYAAAISRLENEVDVYESYQVLRAAGIELSKEAQACVDSQARDWRFVCRIDREGRVWTASLRQKNMSAW